MSATVAMLEMMATLWGDRSSVSAMDGNWEKHHAQMRVFHVFAKACHAQIWKETLIEERKKQEQADAFARGDYTSWKFDHDENADGWQPVFHTMSCTKCGNPFDGVTGQDEACPRCAGEMVTCTCRSCGEDFEDVAGTEECWPCWMAKISASSTSEVQ